MISDYQLLEGVWGRDKGGGDLRIAFVLCIEGVEEGVFSHLVAPVLEFDHQLRTQRLRSFLEN